MRGRSFVSQWRYTSYNYRIDTKPSLLSAHVWYCLRNTEFLSSRQNVVSPIEAYALSHLFPAAISLLLNLKRCLVCSPPSYRAERFLESYSSRRLNCTVRLFTPFRDLRNCCFAPGSWVSIVFVMSEILYGYFLLAFFYFFFLFYRVERYILFVVNKIKFYFIFFYQLNNCYSIFFTTL